MQKPILIVGIQLLYLFPSALPAQPPLHITGLRINALVDDRDNFANGTLQINISLDHKPVSAMTVILALKDGNILVAHKEIPLSDSMEKVTIAVPHPKLWSAETPNLYDLQVRLIDSGADTAAAVSTHTGFRQLVIRNGALLLNGRPILLKGVNRSGLAEAGGQPRSHESMLQDIRLWKQLNINALLMPYSPDAADWYDLCDQYGIYVAVRLSALNGDQQAATNSITGQDRNHPCIITRSIGDHDLQGNFIEDAFYASGRLMPVTWEVKKTFQDITTTLINSVPSSPLPKTAIAANPASANPHVQARPVNIRIANTYFFRDLSNVILKWEVVVNGAIRQTGAIPDLPIGPQRSATFRIPVRPFPGEGDEVLLNLRYTLKKAEPLLPAGSIIATGQLTLRQGRPADVTVRPDGELSYTDDPGVFIVSSPFANLQFNKQTGWLQHYEVKGKLLLDDSLGLRSNFWRAPTDRDRAAGMPKLLYPWKLSSQEPHLQLFSTSTASDIVIIKTDYELTETACLLHIRYTINARGEIQVEQNMEPDSSQKTTGADTAVHLPSAPSLPRFGMQWTMPAGFDSITYYGRGPQENYADRNDAAQAGIYSQSVQEQFFPYDHPQETGTRTAVRWWKVYDRRGKGLVFTADSSLLSMSALHYFNSDLDDSGSVTQERSGNAGPRPQTQLNIDYRQMGIGGRGLPYKEYHYTFKVTPL